MKQVPSFAFDDYDFQVRMNPANVAALMQRDVFYKTGDNDYQFLRSFYFDDIMPEMIQAFCNRFADNSTYRELSLARKVDWAQCNDLFLRNCFNPYFQPDPVLEDIGSLMAAYQFFKEYSATIIARADYQHIYQYDSAILPDAHRPDLEISDIVSAFNQIKGVKTLASCQGVSGTVSYQKHNILTLSPHARYAYIWFAEIVPSIEDSLRQMRFAPAIYSNDVYPTLQSTGDNPAFLSDIRRWLSQSTT